MSFSIMIPARYASSRFPGKPLVPVRNEDGTQSPLIEHTWRAACRVAGADAIYVVTDDARIAKTAEGFGADVIMTSSVCRNGTERCAEALDHLDDVPEIVVNLQGDAPLTPPWFIEELVTALSVTQGFGMATPVLRCDARARERLLNDRRNDRVGGTTAIFAANSRALYFSKEVLPFGGGDTYHHVGVYAYRPAALRDYQLWPEGRLERSEGLEQLRFLENNAPVLCVEVDAKGRDFWEVNNPEDVAIVERMARAGLETVLA